MEFLFEGYGALAQLGERYNGIVEVSGSIPLGSTIPPVLPRYGHGRTAEWQWFDIVGPDRDRTLADEFSSAGVFRVSSCIVQAAH